jgi:hypothetical protein
LHPGFEGCSSRVALPQIGQGELGANELGSVTLTLVFEPIGEYEAQVVIVRIRDDSLKEELFVGHGQLSFGAKKKASNLPAEDQNHFPLISECIPLPVKKTMVVSPY